MMMQHYCLLATLLLLFKICPLSATAKADLENESEALKGAESPSAKIFLQLPHEIWIDIIDRLDSASFKVVSRVSKYFNSFCHSEQLLPPNPLTSAFADMPDHIIAYKLARRESAIIPFAALPEMTTIRLEKIMNLLDDGSKLFDKIGSKKPFNLLVSMSEEEARQEVADWFPYALILKVSKEPGAARLLQKAYEKVREYTAYDDYKYHFSLSVTKVLQFSDHIDDQIQYMGSLIRAAKLDQALWVAKIALASKKINKPMLIGRLHCAFKSQRDSQGFWKSL